MTSEYQSVHQNPKGMGDQRPTASQIISDNQLQGKWSGKTVLITGCSSGIGVETARAILQTGATLYLTARDLEKAKSALGDIHENDRVNLLELDLASLASVRKCADDFLASSSNLNVLITNAGVMATPEGRTVDGHETQLGTNHLAHFLLTNYLLPTMLSSSSADFQSRIVILASSAHRHGGINFSNINFEGEYNSWMAYAQSKTANVYHATELERRYGDKGVHAWAVHPGIVATSLTKNMDKETLEQWGQDPEVGNALKNPEQGAATSVWAAAAKALEGRGGLYLENCQISEPARPHTGLKEYVPGYVAHTYDEEKAGLLWEKSVELLKPFLTKV
ncbi:NAD(P)-binding protein [Corynespora cassiicola Philippines]|uniref:NAD(P)-binding protein n=1 Tax=Corynespora cassiicola Philippines TaxID=1448308 RepID=A0A2T2PCY2_CORCC|nr:NAD(P)-binding protein [Corynespora cassiicola Philippines]